MERMRDPDLVSRFCEQEGSKRAPKLGQVTDREGDQEGRKKKETPSCRKSALVSNKPRLGRQGISTSTTKV